MSSTQNTVFISYRREPSRWLAKSLFDKLRDKGFDVFLDIEEINSGDFNRIILGQIAARAHFVLLLTPGTTERCANKDDWLRREIEHAMDKERNIVPIMVDDFSFTIARPHLTGKLALLETKYNGMPLYFAYFDEGVDRLVERFLKPPVYVDEQPVSSPEIRIAKEKIEKAIQSPRPTQNMLTAEEYVRQGDSKEEQNDFFNAITHYTNAIHLAPKYTYAYYKRGIVYSQLEIKALAKADFQRYVELGGHPMLVRGFINRLDKKNDWRLLLYMLLYGTVASISGIFTLNALSGLLAIIGWAFTSFMAFFGVLSLIFYLLKFQVPSP